MVILHSHSTARVLRVYVVVQRVFAIGKPPDGKLCFFRGLKNVVVLPAQGGCHNRSLLMREDHQTQTGPRSLASCLAGGDLDG